MTGTYSRDVITGALPRRRELPREALDSAQDRLHVGNASDDGGDVACRLQVRQRADGHAQPAIDDGAAARGGATAKILTDGHSGCSELLAIARTKGEDGGAYSCYRRLESLRIETSIVSAA